ncbi:MAG: TOBE domain-containing protein [candidate division NC10 bacterium]|nr:TOBE domain-containing protein [candidate division NC10 bacterium]
MAQFIGRTNLLTARVLAAGPSGIELDVAGQRIRVSTEAARAAIGQTIRLVIRPEVIELRPASPSPSPLPGYPTQRVPGGGRIEERGDSVGGIPGTIVSRTFLGEKAEYQVRVGDDLLQVTSYNPVQRGLFSVGQPVTLHFPPDGIQLLPGGAA